MGRLNRLELYNFKSYKGHHILLFGDSYFTSIIGPNGSGKSNSMDAISFVLGIKSSHLRSAHLRDLVYRGRVLKTATINEDGSATINGANGHANGDDQDASQLTTEERTDRKSAWVMAVFEDDAGDEQMWKRSITNQGTSEYRINNRVVTAQQYNEALESENILIKARNFLVFQGDVEAIASQSPRDLTRLIEQISGSLEYKNEYERLKEQQEEAIENQNHHLNRRRGINSEIKQYQEQKREADNYAKKADARDQAIVTHVLWKLHQFQHLIEESEAEIQKHQEEMKEFRRGIAKYEQQLDQAKQEQSKVSQGVHKTERKIKTKESEAEERERALLPIAEKIHLTQENALKVHSRVAGVQKERDSKAEVVKRLTKDIKTVEKAEQQWESEWKKLHEREGRALSEADVQEYSKFKEDVSKRTSADQIKADNAARQCRADAETVNSLKSKTDMLAGRVKELESDMAGTSENKARIKQIVAETNNALESKKSEQKSLTSERRRVAQLRTELDEKLQAVLIKLLDAEDGRKQSDKELKMRATVADMKRIFPGVRGRVHELCQPRQKKYTDAVSTVLGRHIDAIIVDDEKTARECIQFLREGRRGQATFIPLDTIHGTNINSNLRGIQKGTRMAIDVIDYDRVYEPALSYVCGNAIICDDLKTARYLCYEKRIDAKAVTLDGAVIHKGGLMTGGRGKDRSAKHWEDAEVDKMRSLADKLRSDLQGLPDARRNATEEENLQSEISGLEQRLVFAKEEQQALDRNIASKQKELTHAKKDLNDAQPKYNTKQKELEALEKELQTVRRAIGKIEDQVFAQFCKRLGYDNIRAYEAQQGTLQQEGAEKRLEFKQQKSRLESRKALEAQQLKEFESRIQNLQTKADRDQQLVRELEDQKEALAVAADELATELEALKEKLEEQRAALAEHAELVAEQRRELQKRSKNEENTLREMARLEADAQRASADRYTLLRRCKIEDIVVPLTTESNSLEDLPVDGISKLDDVEDAMDVDGDPSAAPRTDLIQDHGIIVDFEELDDDLRDNFEEKMEEELQNKITALDDELKGMAPNQRAIERLEMVEGRLKTTEKEFEDSRRRAKKAKEDFQDVKERRFDLFSRAFAHISEQIDPIYKELTKSASFPLGGQAYLDMEDSDEPYLDGIKYHAMPPLKRFRDMEHLSGGEKTMAALALLFSIHSYQPSPFFVLDEVDAALDNANVAKIANYIREHAGPGMQFIVISLKAGLFQTSEALVGIHRDQSVNSSKALTLDLRKYQ